MSGVEPGTGGAEASCEPGAAGAAASPVDALSPGWRRALAGTPVDSLLAAVRERRAHGEVIYPPADMELRALALTPLEEVRVVILGQDPYHGAGQATGLAFSVPAGVRLPPSLRNIFRELQEDAGVPAPSSGDLTPWTRQGVLLLNTALTVTDGKPGSHARLGWGIVTDAIVRAVSDERDGVVFLLWGTHAQQRAQHVDRERHHLLHAPHPSPLSASRGFFGCRHFSQANRLLGGEPIDWALP